MCIHNMCSVHIYIVFTASFSQLMIENLILMLAEIFRKHILEWSLLASKRLNCILIQFTGYE